jgi:hypothetical protein
VVNSCIRKREIINKMNNTITMTSKEYDSMVDKTTWVFLFKSINHKQNNRIINGRYYSYNRK